MDGTERLCIALYGECKPRNYLGGSEAKCLHDAADKIASLQQEVEMLKEENCRIDEQLSKCIGWVEEKNSNIQSFQTRLEQRERMIEQLFDCGKCRDCNQFENECIMCNYYHEPTPPEGKE